VIISRTSQYAIQALVYLATFPPGESVLCRDIAQYLHVPPAYLAKVMRKLGKGGFLHALQGRHGGFCLQGDAEKVTLMQILLVMEGPGFSRDCVLGLKACGDDSPCSLHRNWKRVQGKIITLLCETNLKRLANAVTRGKYLLADLPSVIVGVEE
jgi:Rrf2 family protein